ncbi:MAG: Na+:solute symporter [bacterium]|nr:Na+:solute symporter [bacterium]
MATIDIIIIITYFVISLGIALLLTKKAGRSAEDFFLSGRKLPWWIAGTTMVATTFAADTPLAITEMVAKNGIAGNWLWWNMVAGNILTVFFFAKLWRRANILTDVEFIELRYSGKPAAFLRGFKAIYLGIFMNVIIMGWVNVALATIFVRLFGIPENMILYYIFGAMLLVGLYSALSGLWGIAITDMFQFFIAMGGCIVLAYVVLDLPQVGGIDGLKAALPKHVFNFFPDISTGGKTAAVGAIALSFSAFIAHIFVQWWASWYPGSEPGGGGYVAQRMMSAKDERHSMLATLWFTIAHYALRPWPWILVALASLVLYPELAADPKTARFGYIEAMKHLPPGLLGLLVAAFLAAYMSTISTHLNWGSSYIINDLYKRFIKTGGDEKHYVLASRIVTIILVILSSFLMLYISSIKHAWEFIIECGAGLGLVLILRWFWRRINAWSEIAAMIAPFIAFTTIQLANKFWLIELDLKIEFPISLFFIVGATTITWIVVTFLTKPTEETKLQEFYARVQPNGPGWKKEAAKHKENNADIIKQEPLYKLFLNWFLGIAMVYTSLFSIGKIIFKEYQTGFILLAVTILLFVIISFSLKKE